MLNRSQDTIDTEIVNPIISLIREYENMKYIKEKRKKLKMIK